MSMWYRLRNGIFSLYSFFFLFSFFFSLTSSLVFIFHLFIFLLPFGPIDSEMINHIYETEWKMQTGSHEFIIQERKRERERVPCWWMSLFLSYENKASVQWSCFVWCTCIDGDAAIQTSPEWADAVDGWPGVGPRCTEAEVTQQMSGCCRHTPNIQGSIPPYPDKRK